jgi:hypothetical protein
MAGIKLKGYVLLESMIAMIIVMMCFGFSLAIYNNIVTGSKSKLRVLARIALENEARKAKSGNRLIDETIQYPEFQIDKKIMSYNEYQNTEQLHFIALAPNGFQLGEYNELIRIP